MREFTVICPECLDRIVEGAFSPEQTRSGNGEEPCSEEFFFE
jgi:hypothetical protein